MSQEALTLPQMLEYWDKVPDAIFSRLTWDECKTIRLAKEQDYDIINYDIDGTIVEDCPGRKCDCTIAIWRRTPEDKVAKDYMRVLL